MEGNKSPVLILKKPLCAGLNALLTIYKSFIRPHLDYGGIVFSQTDNESFISKLEQVQYNAALAITGAIK